MGEYIKYKDEEIKIGTMYNLYYATYDKYMEAFKTGKLTRGEGDEPNAYTLPDSGFCYRFPFPDEDHLPLGEIGKNQYNRGLPVTIDNTAVPHADGDEPFTGSHYQIEITQQKLVHKQSDGKLCLALVYRDPLNGENYRVEDEGNIKSILHQIIKNHVLGENDPDKKNLYRQVAIRILKGYRIDKPELKSSQKINKPLKAFPVKRRSKGKGI